MKWGIVGGMRFGENMEDSFRTAAEIGFDGVEIPFIQLDYETELIWSPQGVQQLLRYAERYGMEMPSCIAGRYNFRNFPDDDPAVRAEAEELLLTLVDRCADAGIRRILVAFFGEQQITTEEQMDRVVEGVGRCALKAESRGVTLALEGTITTETFLDIIERIGSEAVGVYYDVGNAVWLGYDGPAELCTLANAGVLAQIHVKDMTHDKRNVPPGEGDVDWGAVGDALGEIGWDDYLVLETPMAEDPLSAYAAYLEFLRDKLSP